MLIIICFELEELRKKKSELESKQQEPQEQDIDLPQTLEGLTNEIAALEAKFESQPKVLLIN